MKAHRQTHQYGSSFPVLKVPEVVLTSVQCQSSNQYSHLWKRVTCLHTWCDCTRTLPHTLQPQSGSLYIVAIFEQERPAKCQKWNRSRALCIRHQRREGGGGGGGGATSAPRQRHRSAKEHTPQRHLSEDERQRQTLARTRRSRDTHC